VGEVMPWRRSPRGCFDWTTDRLVCCLILTLSLRHVERRHGVAARLAKRESRRGEGYGDRRRDGGHEGFVHHRGRWAALVEYHVGQKN
jgi:hypothetical protein